MRAQKLMAAKRAARRLTQKQHRIERARTRFDDRAWVVTRRARTRQLIELGGLVAKAGLVDLADDDRAMLYGAFLDLAQRLRDAEGAARKLIWKRRGARAFADEAEQARAARSTMMREDGTGAG
jgi:hypothetical protein